MRGSIFNMEAAPDVAANPLGENSHSWILLRKIPSKNADLWRFLNIPSPALQHPYCSWTARYQPLRPLWQFNNSL